MPKKETIQVHLAAANPHLSPATRFGKLYFVQFELQLHVSSIAFRESVHSHIARA
jgi:hypothetical protein